MTSWTTHEHLSQWHAGEGGAFTLPRPLPVQFSEQDWTALNNGWKLKKSYKETLNMARFCFENVKQSCRHTTATYSSIAPCLRKSYNSRFPLEIPWKTRMPELLSFILTHWHYQVTMELCTASVTKLIYYPHHHFKEATIWKLSNSNTVSGIHINSILQWSSTKSILQSLKLLLTH